MHSDMLNYTKLAFNSLKMIQNDTVYQPIIQWMIVCFKHHFSILQPVHARFYELEEFHNNNMKFTVICLQECWVYNETNASLIQIPGYNCIVQGKSSSKFGGLIMYIDKQFEYKNHLALHMYDHWEGQIVNVSGRGLPKTIVIGNIYTLYRPPRMLVAQINQFINELTLQLQSIGKCKNIIIAGDYNFNLLKINENCKCMKDTVQMRKFGS